MSLLKYILMGGLINNYNILYIKIYIIYIIICSLNYRPRTEGPGPYKRDIFNN